MKLAEASSEEFLALKQALQPYVRSRTVSPPAEHITRRAAAMPRLVPAADKIPTTADSKHGVDKR